MADREDDVPRFQDDQQVYAQLGGMFEDALADDAAGGRLRAIGGTVQWQLRKPTARITVKLGEEQTPGVDFGDTQAKPEVVLSMDADTAHRFWAGELPMHVALSRGLIRAKGPVATILRIVPVVGPAKDLYAARIAGGGAARRRRPRQPRRTLRRRWWMSRWLRRLRRRRPRLRRLRSPSPRRRPRGRARRRGGARAGA